MDWFVAQSGMALLMAAGMAWKVVWSLILGLALSGLIQATISKERIQEALGRSGIKEVGLATLAGAASSSCSYASASITRTLLKKGAALVPALAFLFASTNLVLELGIILWLLLGWQFALAEWIGGVVLIAIMAGLVRLTYPKTLVDAARQHEEPGGGHQHAMDPVAGRTWWARLRNPELPTRVAQSFAMDVTMLWKDIAGGFLIAGVLSAFVPRAWWATLFVTDAHGAWQSILNALIGPVIAMLTFVCSIGNVPMAAILWSSGISFSGVLAFLFADLIVLPLLDTYRRQYGWRMAAYIGGVFYATMVAAALVMDLLFSGIGWVPPQGIDVRAEVTSFAFDYTFWLNLVFGALAAWLFLQARRHPMHHDHAQHGHHEHHEHAHGTSE